MTWNRDMKAAPRDRPVFLKTRHGGRVTAEWFGGFGGFKGQGVCAWVAMHGSEFPPSWTDGVCWAVNEDGKPSDPPIAWWEE